MTLVDRLIELREKAKALNAGAFWLDNNNPWRIMVTRGRSHYAVAEQHPENTPGDGEWKDGKTICDALNELLALVKEDPEAIAALSHPSGESGWMPIDTAPKDGKALLLYVPENRCVYTAIWVEHRGWWEIFGSDYRDHLQRASHWMPLPPSPVSKETVE